LFFSKLFSIRSIVSNVIHRIDTSRMCVYRSGGSQNKYRTPLTDSIIMSNIL